MKDILLYSGGSFIGRILTLFLLPLTTSYLTPGDYGIIGILTLMPTLMNGLFSLGFHTSLGRVYSSGKEEAQREGIIWTAFCTLVLNNLLLTSVAILFSKQISFLLFGEDIYSYLVRITFIGIGICTVRMAFEYYLRASGKSKKVFFLNVVDVTISISTMIFAVVYLQRGAKGYMEAFALAQTLNLLVVFVCVAIRLKFSIQWHYMKELLKIGIPCIYGYWGYCLLQGISRYILQIFSNEEEVGLFFLGSNLGRIIELPLWGFMSAWVPFFNTFLHKQSEAGQVFSKIMTYYLLAMSSIVAALFCFARPVVHTFLQSPFHDVWKVVGLTGLAQALWGVYAITYPPLIFYKKTGVQSCMEMGAGLGCILANMILVPLFQKEGAALATLLGFLGLILMSLLVNQRLLFISYDTRRIVKIVVALLLLGSLSFISISEEWVYNLLMGSCLLLFYSYCWVCLLSIHEKSMIKGMVFRKFIPESP